ncbi:MAG: tetratricopeptide repeat protein [Planctomycetes bacterium]|nr:tetratricopeptide repeat protein [Planctomycetota bacterium]
MAQKLNKKLVGILVVSIMVLMTVTGFVLLQNLNIQDPSKYVADGDKYMAEGDHDKALQAYNRAYLKDSNKNPDYLVKAARCAIELGDIKRARDFIQFAKVRDAQHKGALETELDLEFEIAPFINNVNQWNDVLANARTMVEMPEFAESAKVQYAIGKAYLELRKEDASYEEKGVAALKRSLELDPTNIDVVTLRAEQMSRQALEKEADQLTDEAAALRKERIGLISAAIDKCNVPEDDAKIAKLKELKARCLLVDGDVDEGSRLLRELAKSETDRTDARLMLGRLLTGAFRVPIEADLDEAERLLKSAHDADPTAVPPYFALGALYKIQADKETSEEGKAARLAEFRALYQEGLEKIERSKHYRKLANNRARVQLIEELFLMDISDARDAADESQREQALARAEKLAERLKEERPPESLEVRFAMGHLYSARGDLISATREADAARSLPEGANNSAVLRLSADLYTRQGQWGIARDILQKLLPLNAGDPALYIGMARVLLNLNQATEALVYLKPNEPASVREELQTNRAAVALRIEAYRQLKQFDLADRESQLLGEGAPEDEVRSAQILIWEGKFGEAETKLEAVLASAPSNEAAIRTKLQLLEESNRREEAREYVEALIAQHPDNRRFKQFRLAFTGDASPEERDAQLLQFINEEPDEYTRNTALCGFYERRGEIDKAIQSLDSAERIKPEAPAVVEGQFTLSIRKKDWDRASKYAKRIGELNTDGTQGKIAEGRLVLAKAAEARAGGNAEEARKLTDQAVDLMRAGLDAFPNISQGWTYLAGAYLDAGRTEEAKTTLVRALSINPNNGHASLFLARIAQNEGDETAERKHLADASRLLADDEWLKSRQRYYKEKDDPITGIAYREGLLKTNPDDADNLLRLARLYADPKVAKYDSATDAFQKRAGGIKE